MIEACAFFAKALMVATILFVGWCGVAMLRKMKKENGKLKRIARDCLDRTCDDQKWTDTAEFKAEKHEEEGRTSLRWMRR